MERVGVNNTSSSTNIEADQETVTQESTDNIVNLDNNNDSMKIAKLGVSLISSEEKFFINQEKRTQMFLFSLLIIHVLCILPINIFKLVLPSLQLSLAPGTTDLAYLALLWVSHLPCSAIPPLYALWAAGSSEPSSALSFSEISNRRARGQKEHQRRISEIRLEDLNRRASILGSSSPLKSPAGSLISHRSGAPGVPDPDYTRSPLMGGKTESGPGGSRQNSLVVAVQARRASIISINNQAQAIPSQVSQENLLDVGPSGPGHHTRSASVRSSHSSNLLQPHTPHIVVEADRSDIKDPRPGRRKSYAPTHYGRNSSFRHRDGNRSSPKKSRRYSIQPQQHLARF